MKVISVNRLVYVYMCVRVRVWEPSVCQWKVLQNFLQEPFLGPKSSDMCGYASPREILLTSHKLRSEPKTLSILSLRMKVLSPFISFLVYEQREEIVLHPTCTRSNLSVVKKISINSHHITFD